MFKVHKGTRSYITGWTVLLSLSLIYMIISLFRQSPAILATSIMSDLNLDASKMGLLNGALFYTYAILQIPAGHYVYNIGMKKSIIYSLIISAISFFMFAVFSNFYILLISRILTGVGLAFILVPVLDILANWFKDQNFPQKMSIIISAGGLGILLGSSPLAIINNMIGWRGSFIAIAILAIVCLLVVILLIEEHPKEETEIKEDLKPDISPRDNIFKEVKTVLKNKQFYPPTLWGAITIGIFSGFGGLWAGPYLQQTLGLSINLTGLILSMLAMGMIAGSPALTYFAKKVIKSSKLTLALASFFSAIIFVYLIIKGDHVPVAGLFIVFLLLSAFSFSLSALTMNRITTVFSGNIKGTAIGAYMTFIWISSASLQQVTGWILDKSHGKTGYYNIENFDEVFYLYIALCLLATIIIAIDINKKDIERISDEIHEWLH